MPLRGTTLFVALVPARTENNGSADNFPFLVVDAVVGDVRVEVNVSNLILSIGVEFSGSGFGNAAGCDPSAVSSFRGSLQDRRGSRNNRPSAVFRGSLQDRRRSRDNRPSAVRQSRLPRSSGDTE